MKLITAQTGSEGKIVSRVYLEKAYDLKSELYFCITSDRETGGNTIIASRKGGINIEDVAETFPGGWPRHNLGYYLLKYGFHIKKRHLIFTEPFKKKKLSDPKKIWPIILDQNIWAEK